MLLDPFCVFSVMNLLACDTQGLHLADWSSPQAARQIVYRACCQLVHMCLRDMEVHEACMVA